MVDIEAKKQLLRKRISALSLTAKTMEGAAEAVAAARMKGTGAADDLRKEWLNDLVAATDANVFRNAARDPDSHFLSWIAERTKNPFHVTYRAVEAAALRLGPEIANRMILVVWPQEIAWAQRLRLSDNPNIATKAAMFLREAEGHPAKIFGKIADLFGEAIMKAGYSDNPAQEISPEEIRFADVVPEFNPLFLRYAARTYSGLLIEMSRDKIELLAERASRDEHEDRRSLAVAKSASSTRRFPMRRILSIQSSAISMGMASNDLYLAECSFLEWLEAGKVDIDRGVSTPHAPFLSLLSEPSTRMALLKADNAPDVTDDEIRWDIAHLDRRWLDGLPDAYQRWSRQFQSALENWQLEVVEERRVPPYDPVSDFGFFLLEKEQSA